MGARLAGLLGDAFAADEEARNRAAAAGGGMAVIDQLAAPEADEAPETDVFRRLVEAAGIDTDRALRAAQDDGMLFEGAEWTPDEPVREIMDGVRLIEAADQTGATPGTRRYDVIVIRPGEGKGEGLRIYTQKMLRENAANFGGQPIFFNHEDLAKLIQRGHGSRDPRDLAGWLQEATRWDPNYTESEDDKNGWEKGAVRGTADFLVEAADFIDRLPSALALSINMAPTKLKAKRRRGDGKLGTLVEGVVKGSGSVDLITGEAGAGGKVLERLREAATARYAGAHDVLANALDNEDARQRLVEALAQPVAAAIGAPPPTEDPVTDIDVSKLTPEERAKLVHDVLNTDEARDVLVEALAGSDQIDRLVEAKVEEAREQGRQEADDANNRVLDLRDFRDEAVRLIESSSRERGGILVPSAVEDLKGRFMLRDGRNPTPALDVQAGKLADGSDGTALEVLVEAVTAAIKMEETKLREAAPTRVRGLGPGEPDPLEAGGGDDPAGGGGDRKPHDPMADSLGLDPAKVAANRGGR